MKKNACGTISISLIVMLLLGVLPLPSTIPIYSAAEKAISEEGWYYVSTLPTDVNATYYEIQYQNVYEQYAADSPGIGWSDTGVDNKVPVKSGATYELDEPISTSDTVWLDHYYYYHFCGKSTGTTVNPSMTDIYMHLDEIHDTSSIYEYMTYADEYNAELTYYHLKWLSGLNAYCYRNATEGTCDGTEGQHGTRSCYWYKKYVYQNYTLEMLNLYQKVSEWGSIKDASATTINIRYRLKPTSVTLSQTAVTLTSIGETVELSAVVKPSDVVDKSVTWESSNTAVATVNENGLVTAVGNGVATITATSNLGAKTGTCEVTVSISTTGVSINKTRAALTSIGQVLQLTASIQPSNAANKLVTWKSSDPSVATVSSSGLVTAVDNGTTTITVTTLDGGKTATCKLIVSVVVTDVSLNKTSATLTKDGETLQLQATVAPSNAVNKTLTWKSSNTSVATVNANGLVTAVGNGTTTITATSASGDKKATCKLTVNIGIEEVRLEQTTVTLTSKGETAQMEVAIEPSNAVNKNVTWKSSDTSVAKVDANGLVTAVGNGTASVTVTTDSGNKTATCTVIVSIATTGVSLNETSIILTSEGATAQLIAKVSPSDAANQNVTWKSSDTSVVTVNSSGLITAIGNGTATITVTTSSGSKTATCNITVDIAEPVQILVHPESQTIRVNEVAIFTVEFTEEELQKVLSYQWQYSQSGNKWYNSGIEGADTASLVVDGLAKRDGQMYRCVVTDINGNKVISDTATLTVNTYGITKQPESQIVNLNDYATFMVEAFGEGLNYQWQYSQSGNMWYDSGMEGADTENLVIEGLAKRNGQMYRCVITDINGNKAISDVVILTVNTYGISKQPESQNVNLNDYAIFMVEAFGEGLNYQWQYSQSGNMWYDSGMEGAETSSLTVGGLEKRNGQMYRCVITDINGNRVISDVITLTVNTYGITKQPESKTVNVNGYVTFTVEAFGEDLSYQWQYSQSGNLWYDSGMEGAKTASLIVEGLAKRDGQMYRCVITDINGRKVISDVVTLIVNSSRIIIQPESQTVSVNEYATFTVKVSGDGLSYQWQYSQSGKMWYNSGMEGAKTSSLRVEGLAKRNGQMYRCVITDANGNELISEAAELTIE